MSEPIARLLSISMLLAILAGCVQQAPPPSESPAATAGIVLSEDRPSTTFGEVATGPAAAPDLNATTAAAPKLVKGEWWKIKFDGQVFGDINVPPMVRVVAEARPDGYIMGMPHEGWFKEAIVFHTPAFGDVDPDLSFDTHNVRFEPLRFPLTQGATWTTRIAQTNYTATVERADEHTATIRYDPQANAQPTDIAYATLLSLSPIGGAGTMRMTYDARQHEIVKFETDLGGWEVVEHGYGFTGWVTVPRGEHTAIDHGQFLAASPGDPSVTHLQDVDPSFNRLTILQIIAPMGPGEYRTRSISPNGTAYETEETGSSLVAKVSEAADPGGPWTIEDLVAGPGATYTMGMAYHQYDIRLPDGAIRADHSHPVGR